MTGVNPNSKIVYLVSYFIVHWSRVFHGRVMDTQKSKYLLGGYSSLHV